VDPDSDPDPEHWLYSITNEFVHACGARENYTQVTDPTHDHSSVMLISLLAVIADQASSFVKDRKCKYSKA
jgi:hypothetical protein